jgi:predicted flap endonuclease-1-like 5' DNA nuclease
MNDVLWFLLGLVLGMVVAFVICGFLWRRWAGEREDDILGLKGLLREKEQDLRGLDELLQEQKTTVLQLQDQVSQGETKIGALASELQEQKEVAGQLKLSVAAISPATKRDNLKRIEGIGPRISALLQEAGVTTFAQLAVTEVSRLEQIVRGAHLEMIDPGTWPEQARLAADGRWDALQVLQDELKGGRRA